MHGDPVPGLSGSEVEKAILAHVAGHPTHVAQRVADELMLRGVQTRTPYQVFKKGIQKPRNRKTSTKKEAKPAA